jgi:predicted RNase H-like nuclease (RuvC/YqgF family)
MSSVVIYTSKSGRKYAYESVSYYDKDKKQPRNKRKLLGIVDPESGEIVPTSRKKKETESSDDFRRIYANTQKKIDQYESRIADLEAKVSLLQSENKKLSDRIAKASAILNK